MEHPTTRCHTCNAPKGEERCRTCRRNEYYVRIGLELAECSRCLARTAVRKSGICRSCLREQGLKECRKCGSVLLAFVSFYAKQAVCKTCRNLRAPEAREG